MAPDRNDRLAALGNELVEVHIWLREELAELRDDVDSFLDGRGERPRELRTHCLTFCSVLTRHHTGEDDGAFPVLAHQFPELASVIAELSRDHHLVSGVVHRLTDLLDGLDEHSDPILVRTELASLAALLETHFGYEERKLVAALNSLRTGTAEQLLGVSAAELG